MDNTGLSVKQYVFDGSYVGFLTSIFESFERKHFEIELSTKENFVASFFDESFEIISDPEKAKRVMLGLKKKLPAVEVINIYKVFLSENISALQSLVYLIQNIFKNRTDILENFGDAKVLEYHQTLKKVDRERHRMKAFVRFQKSEDGMFYCMVEPDFNVLPLISDFFRKRYADQKWLIYDVKRKYGLHYNLSTIDEVYLSTKQKNDLSTADSIINLNETEEHFQTLWKQYFKSTNIEARKNIKLHLQHVPRRYWKYLVEKQ